MIENIDAKSIIPCTGCSAKSARNLVRTFEDGEISLTPEKTDEERRLESSTISYSRQLTAEEEKRVLFLKNMLSQLLAMTDGQPTEEQRSRIKEIEKELEKITGVKTRSRISDATSKMPEKKDKEEEEEEELLEKQMSGIDPKESIHSRMPDMNIKNGPGIMQFIQRNGISAYLKNSELKPLGELSSIKA